MLMPLKIALQFLTRFPVQVKEYRVEHLRSSLYWYAVVGALLGGALCLLQILLLMALPWDADPVVAILLLVAWVLATGALHLDGLADSADAWLGGHGDREKALRIMKDPQSGPAGVVAIVLVLLLKFALILFLQQHQQLAYLLLVPLTARALIPMLFYTTPYVRSEGLGSPFSEGLEFIGIWPGLLLAALAGVLLSGLWWLLALGLAALTFIAVRKLMLQRLGGTTGDTAGALIEMLECALLLGCVWAI